MNIRLSLIFLLIIVIKSNINIISEICHNSKQPISHWFLFYDWIYNIYSPEYEVLILLDYIYSLLLCVILECMICLRFMLYRISLFVINWFNYWTSRYLIRMNESHMIMAMFMITWWNLWKVRKSPSIEEKTKATYKRKRGAEEGIGIAWRQ